jgi:hypothetical protein
MAPTPDELRDLYHEDETAWLAEMVRLISEGRHDKLDFEHLGEYLAHQGYRDQRDVMNRLTALMTNLLKWEHQPELRSRSRRRTIAEQRLQLFDLLESPSLRAYAADAIAKAYRRAVSLAAIETGLPAETFAETEHREIDQLLTEPLSE